MTATSSPRLPHQYILQTGPAADSQATLRANHILRAFFQRINHSGQSSSEEIAVRAGALQPKFVVRHSVYQNPVRLNMTIASAFPCTFQGVIQVLRRQRAPIKENINNRNELVLILALPDLPLDVLLELRGL